ncbi:DUF3644 domain-containing protein [Dysgonomonas sp. ZJ709]|uniref:DUF3644 domain-containing protein n=1 Tax=Dysgonomonas sp. ZJ709 TaxID=2709797 RepID=UPI0013EB08E7|nr:DUF3644 domain-containing protein [Dysgonomonas sp. ZJ709]
MSRINQTYRSLLDKSIASILSAIEIYNKPNFGYREESFAILAVNAWELLLKAYLLRLNNYKMNAVYVLEPVLKKNGQPSSTRKQPKLNRCNNPKSISIFETIARLKEKLVVSKNLIESIESLIELRDNAIHFINSKPITKQVQELGFANIKNYISTIKKWELEIDLSEYNFYLMPLAYVDARVDAGSILTDETKNYLNLIKSKIQNQDIADQEFDIAISIDIDFKKGNSFDEKALGFKYDPDGIGIALSEEDIRKKFPWTHADLIDKCKERYSNFKQGVDFNTKMKVIKANEKLHHNRKLDPANKKSQGKPFYSSNIFKELDKHFIKK